MNRFKDEFVLLGTVKYIASNGLSVYENGKKRGQISGGQIGDVVLEDKTQTSLSKKFITMNIDEWKNIPQRVQKSGEIKVADEVSAFYEEDQKVELEVENV